MYIYMQGDLFHSADDLVLKTRTHPSVSSSCMYSVLIHIKIAVKFKTVVHVCTTT